MAFGSLPEPRRAGLAPPEPWRVGPAPPEPWRRREIRGFRWLVVFAMQAIVQGTNGAAGYTRQRNQARARRAVRPRGRVCGWRSRKYREWRLRRESLVFWLTAE